MSGMSGWTLVERHTDPVNESSDRLTARALRVQHAADVVRTDDASDVDGAEVPVDLNFDEDSTEGMHRTVFALDTRCRLRVLR